MKKQEAIKEFETQAKLARALGIASSSITRWSAVPTWHQRTIERLTKGKLKADKPPIPEKPKQETSKYCFVVPVGSYKEFKKLCQKQNVSMSSKITDFIELFVMEN